MRVDFYWEAVEEYVDAARGDDLLDLAQEGRIKDLTFAYDPEGFFASFLTPGEPRPTSDSFGHEFYDGLPLHEYSFETHTCRLCGLHGRAGRDYVPIG